MFRVRFHGRGGQGMKTASRILGTAFFLEGWNVQDAPRYGAERRGAPIFAYVRADHDPIDERGIIVSPDLAVVADESLLIGPATSAVTGGLTERAVLLVRSYEPADVWRDRLKVPCRVVQLTLGEADAASSPVANVGSRCVGAAARLLGVIGRESLTAAVAEELIDLGPEGIADNQRLVLEAYDQAAPNHGCATEGALPSVECTPRPDWIELGIDGLRRASPTIHGTATSLANVTSLWRGYRPIIHGDVCHGCWWVCGTFCPDNCIQVSDDGYPQIDYDHCKGCLICAAQCPYQAVEVVPETRARGDLQP